MPTSRRAESSDFIADPGRLRTALPHCHPELVEGSWQRSKREHPASGQLLCQDPSTPRCRAPLRITGLWIMRIRRSPAMCAAMICAGGWYPPLRWCGASVVGVGVLDDPESKSKTESRFRLSVFLIPPSKPGFPFLASPRALPPRDSPRCSGRRPRNRPQCRGRGGSLCPPRCRTPALRG